MPLFVVRHAKAGSRAKWDGEDALRPLSTRGRRQATAIAKRLSAELEGLRTKRKRDRPRLVSSPYTRCIQTLEPLGKRPGIPVEPDDRLAEGSWFHDALAVLDELSDGSAICSHGDVIFDLVAGLERRGMQLTGDPDWRKGATWVIERDGDGCYVSAYAVPPPDSA